MRMDELPDDVETLKRLIIEKDADLLADRLLIEKLKLQIARYKRIQFGRSSEHHD